jgi:hypothetical protein
MLRRSRYAKAQREALEILMLVKVINKHIKKHNIQNFLIIK